MKNIMKLIFKPNESLEMLKAYYPNQWRDEIEEHIQIILGVALAQKLLPKEALKVCLNITTNINNVIRYEAAFKYMQSIDNVNNNIDEIKDQILTLSIQSGLIEQRSNISPKERSFTRTALYNKIKKLKIKEKRLHYARKTLLDIPVKATIIQPNGSEHPI